MMFTKHKVAITSLSIKLTSCFDSKRNTVQKCKTILSIIEYLIELLSSENVEGYFMHSK